MNEWVIKIKLFGTSTKEINVTRLLIKKYIKLVFQRSGGISCTTYDKPHTILK